MRVSVKLDTGREVEFDARHTPVAIVLSRQDKKNIAGMTPGATVYASFPDGTPLDVMREWVARVKRRSALDAAPADDPALAPAGEARFDADLRVGRIAERMVLAALRDGTVESKYCTRVHELGTVPVEKGWRGRPSGISVSTANWWVFVCGDESRDPTNPRCILFVPAARLRALVAEHERDVVVGGDGGQAMLVKVPFRAFA